MKPAFDWLLLAFGAVLALVGLYWMWSGWDIIQIERGWVSVISGAIMLSGGVMVSALAYGVMTFRAALQGGAPERASERVRPPLPDVLRPRPPEAESAAQESQRTSQYASQRAPLREPHRDSLAAREGASPGLATPAIVAAAAAAGAAAVSQATKASPRGDAPEGDLAAEARKESGAPSFDETPDDVALKEAAIEEALALPLDENPEPDSDEAQQEFDARVREAGATAAVGQEIGQEIGQETGSLEDESRGFGRWFRRRPRAEPVETRPAPQPVAREQSDIDRALESELADALGLAPEKPVEAAGFQAALDETARQERARREAAERESAAMAAGDATAVEKKAGEKPDDETAEKRSAKLDEERAEAGTADEDAEVDLEIARELRRDAAPPPPAPEAAPKPEPAILGRHTSGDTTYTMFADGSIEAETPDGIMRFDSLIELRRHVEQAGEA